MLGTRISRIVFRPGDNERGFSLLEAITAIGLMAGALAALGQMFAISVANNRSARAVSYATVLAQQKMEQLRGLTWGFDTLGQPISDTTSDTAAPAETPTGGTGLSPSPAGTLTSSTDGWVDYVDQSGDALGGGTALPPGTVYIRRWAVEPLPSNPADTIVIQVFVTTRVGRGEARLISLKTRKMP
jgi:type II secretory pathway pseudopilin PulG